MHFFQQLNSARAKYSVSAGPDNSLVRAQSCPVTIPYCSCAVLFISAKIAQTSHSILSVLISDSNTLIKELLTVVMESCRYCFLSTLRPVDLSWKSERQTSAEKRGAARFAGHDYHYRELLLPQFNSNGLDVLRMGQTGFHKGGKYTYRHLETPKQPLETLHQLTWMREGPSVHQAIAHWPSP